MQLEFTVTGLKPSRRRRPKPAPRRRPDPAAADDRAVPGEKAVAPVVRTIVLAYQIEQAIRDGRARDYADVARQVGLTRARISQIVALLRLSPAIVETLLLADAGRFPILTERQLRTVLTASDPLTQRDAFKRLINA
jgi:hypothetical protein